MIGRQILSYEIKTLLGEGGMGNVYLAEHVQLGRKVAIKALKPEIASNQEIRKRFRNEASLMAHLQHPNIVSLLDYQESEEGMFLVMEYVDGEGLDEFLAKLKEPLPLERAKEIMQQVLSAFHYAHEEGVVHRDVKPSNILINGKGQVKVLDFGIAKLVGSADFNLTKTGVKVGTVYYMSPEQVMAKDLTRKSDIYSLGVTFYEMLSGFGPYKQLNSEFEIYEKIVKEPLIPLTQTMGESYAAVWSVIAKATAKSPDNRYNTCEEMQMDLMSEAIAPPIEVPKTHLEEPKRDTSQPASDNTRIEKKERFFSASGRIRRSAYFLRNILIWFVSSIVIGYLLSYEHMVEFIEALAELIAKGEFEFLDRWDTIVPAAYRNRLYLIILTYLFSLYLTLVQGVKRLHDMNRSGSLILLMFIPFINSILSLFLLFADGTRGPNKYGPDPKGRTPKSK